VLLSSGPALKVLWVLAPECCTAGLLDAGRGASDLIIRIAAAAGFPTKAEGVLPLVGNPACSASVPQGLPARSEAVATQHHVVPVSEGDGVIKQVVVTQDLPALLAESGCLGHGTLLWIDGVYSTVV
jgi:hypothetical protein